MVLANKHAQTSTCTRQRAHTTHACTDHIIRKAFMRPGPVLVVSYHFRRRFRGLGRVSIEFVGGDDEDEWVDISYNVSLVPEPPSVHFFSAKLQCFDSFAKTPSSQPLCASSHLCRLPPSMPPPGMTPFHALQPPASFSAYSVHFCELQRIMPPKIWIPSALHFRGVDKIMV